MLPGCGSAWKKPSSKIILMMTPTRGLRDRCRCAVGHRSRSIFLPSKNSSVEHVLATTPAGRPSGSARSAWPSKFSAKRSPLSASMQEVELARDRAIELLHEADGRVDLRLGDRALERGGHHVEELEIARDGRRRRPGAAPSRRPRSARRPASLERRRGAPGRSTRSRAASRRSARRPRPSRRAEALLDLLLDVRERDRRDVVLELLQLDDDVGGDDVGARRRDLPELDEGRAELLRDEADALAARDASALVLAGFARLGLAVEAIGGLLVVPPSAGVRRRARRSRRTRDARARSEISRRRPRSRTAEKTDTAGQVTGSCSDRTPTTRPASPVAFGRCTGTRRWGAGFRCTSSSSRRSDRRPCTACLAPCVLSVGHVSDGMVPGVLQSSHTAALPALVWHCGSVSGASSAVPSALSEHANASALASARRLLREVAARKPTTQM